nr:MAG TPA: homing endonuclease [Caudoviricetes sp.]
MKTRTWKAIPGYRGYEVSDDGLVRKTDGTLCLLRDDKNGYKRVSLKGYKRSVMVHRLVGYAFLENDRPDRIHINHKNGIRYDNRVENLEWCTPQENIVHSYDTLLNKNTTHVVVTDITTGEKKWYRSFKDVGRNIGIYPSVFVPYVRLSKDNPIANRYIIEVSDPESMINRSNTIVFGDEIYVYDFLTDETVEYPSILMAAYQTGIRGLSNLRRFKQILDYRRIWYSVSIDKDKLIKTSNLSMDEMKKNRHDYLMKPYAPVPGRYWLYDYYTGEQFEYDCLFDLTEALKTFTGEYDITPSTVSYNIHHYRLKGESALYLGYGILDSNCSYTWKPRTEEEVLRSRYRKSSGCKVYRVEHDGGVDICYSTKEMLEKFTDVGPPIHPGNYSIERILKISNVPNLRITRLDQILPKIPNLNISN